MTVKEKEISIILWDANDLSKTPESGQKNAGTKLLPDQATIKHYIFEMESGPAKGQKEFP